MIGLQPLLFGIKWMDPNWLLDQFGPSFFWVCLVIVLVECGLFFPFLPGDTLLFAVGLFVATRDSIVPGPRATDSSWPSCCSPPRPSPATCSATR